MKTFKFIKYIYVFVLCIFGVLLVGCGANDSGEAIINCENQNILVGTSIDLNIETNVKKPKFNYEITGTSIEIKDNKVYAKEVGESVVKITIDGYSGSKEVVINVCDEGLTITGNKQIVIETEYELKLIRMGVDEDEKITWRSSDTSIARVAKGVITGIGLGKATITAKCDLYTASYEIEIIRPTATEMEIENNVKFEVGAEYTLNYTVYPAWASQDVNIISSDNDVVMVNEDSTVVAKKIGSAKLTVSAKSNDAVVREVSVNVFENEAPKFVLEDNYVENLAIDWNDLSTFLNGIKVTDNTDGDLTEKIEYDTSEALKYGERIIKLSVTDRAGNLVTMDRKVTVNWPYKVKFIGHSGSYLGVPNSEEAFLEAARTLHYQALECDVHITKDGVFVTNHDSIIKDKDTGIEYTIEDCDYDVIKNVVTSYSSLRGHVCTLERYLEICKEYGIEAIIELKWTTGIVPSNQSNLPKLVDLIKSKGMWDDAVILSSMTECLAWFRTNGYNDIRLQVLKSTSDSQETLDYCKRYNVDLSINVTYSQYESTDEWLQKYHDAGLEISTWTFSDTSAKGYEAIQKWIDKGVEYVTCDNHHIDRLDLSNNRK